MWIRKYIYVYQDPGTLILKLMQTRKLLKVDMMCDLFQSA